MDNEFRTNLEILCEAFQEKANSEPHEVSRTYYELYYEILCGYLMSDRDLRPLIANMINQIDIRIPWAQKLEAESLRVVRDGLVEVMEKDPLMRKVMLKSSTY